MVLAVDHDVPPGCRESKVGMRCKDDGVAYVAELCKLFSIPEGQCLDGDRPRYDITLHTRSLELAAVLNNLAKVSDKAPFDIDLDAVALGGWSAGNRAQFILAGATPQITEVRKPVQLAAAKPLAGVPPFSFADFVKLEVKPKAVIGMATPHALKGGHYCKPDAQGCCLDRRGESKACGGGAKPTCADGSWESQSSFAGVKLPMLLGTGSGDCKIFGGEKRCPKSVPVHRRRTFDALPKGDKYLLYFADPLCDAKTFCRSCATGHETFNLGKAVEPCPDKDCSTRDAARRSIRAAARAFLDWHLLKRQEARRYLASDSVHHAGDCHAEWLRK